MRRIHIFDTTLRDGEQSPGASLNLPEKLEIAHQLARLNVDVIEAGFPISSPEDFAAVREIAEQVRGPETCALARVRSGDIEQAWKAVRDAERARIHVFIATSDIHLEHKLHLTREEALKVAVEGVELARHLISQHPQGTVQFSAEDATRSDFGYLCAVIEAAIAAGADVINIPDTVGYAIPGSFEKMIRRIIIEIKAINWGRVTLSIHCHNDLGLAVANSLAGVKMGASQVECTINGLGERAGNASLEEIVMALKVRADEYQVETRIVTPKIYPTSRMVSKYTGLSVQANKAIVGANAFAHEAGIHQDGMLKNASTYEIMRPQDVGVPESRLVLGKHSGRHALKVRLEELGYQLGEAELGRIYERFVELADKKKEVFAEDIVALVEEEVSPVPEVFVLVKLLAGSATDSTPQAYVLVEHEGEKKAEVACGDGPLDAVFRAIDVITGMPLILVDYNLRAITRGKDAIGEAVVKVRDNSHLIIGRGTSTDVIEASAKAYLNAVNKVVWRLKSSQKTTS